MDTWQRESASLSEEGKIYECVEQGHDLTVLPFRTHLPYFKHSGVQHLIAQQANQTPGMLAVVSERYSLTYAQLEQQANQLAHALRRRKIGAGGCVGVYLPLSIDLLIALLAILKAGGCFMPLETTSHSSLVLARLEECAPPLLLTHQKLSKQLASYRGDLLCLDKDQFLWIGESSSAPVVPFDDEQSAFLLFPPDSTGASGGVSISQHSLLIRCLDLLKHLTSKPDTPRFESAFFQLLALLCWGETVTLPTFSGCLNGGCTL